jgi:hypothetical protein
MRTTFAIIAGLLVAGCGQTSTPPTDEQTISQARRLLRSHLQEPGSARFLRVRVAPQQSMGRPAVCGEVDARNAAGKYTGFQRFYVWGGDVGIEPRRNGAEKQSYPGGANAWRASHLRFCRLAGGAMSPPPAG